MVVSVVIVLCYFQFRDACGAGGVVVVTLTVPAGRREISFFFGTPSCYSRPEFGNTKMLLFGSGLSLQHPSAVCRLADDYRRPILPQ